MRLYNSHSSYLSYLLNERQHSIHFYAPVKFQLFRLGKYSGISIWSTGITKWSIPAQPRNPQNDNIKEIRVPNRSQTDLASSFMLWETFSTPLIVVDPTYDALPGDKSLVCRSPMACCLAHLHPAPLTSILSSRTTTLNWLKMLLPVLRRGIRNGRVHRTA